MDKPFNERPFVYTKMQYTLPGSSKFSNLVCCTPEDFEKRFFYCTENITELAKKEKRAILTLAYVQYLNHAETKLMVSKKNKDELLNQVGLHSFLSIMLIAVPSRSGKPILTGITRSRGQTRPQSLATLSVSPILPRSPMADRSDHHCQRRSARRCRLLQSPISKQ